MTRQFSAACCAVLVLAASACFPPSASAQNECKRNSPGKCPQGQTTPPPKKKGGTVTHQATQPTPSSKHKGRDEYTPAQREKFMEEARKLCRAKYGAPSRVYRVDFKRMLVYCEPPSY